LAPRRASTGFRAKWRAWLAPKSCATALGLFFTLSLIFPVRASAQDFEIPEAIYPALPRQAASAKGFVPAGWALESQVSGDLNRDGIADLALVLREQNPQNIVPNDNGLGENPLDANPRILAVAFGRQSAGYTLALENHTLIPRREVPTFDDPLSEGGVAIERGTLRVTMGFFASAGSWATSTTTYTFRHQNGRFELIGFDRDETQRNTGETSITSINYSTGQAKLTTGSIESDEENVRSKSLPSREPITIEQIGDGIEFEPGV
jgi:hypothetical protein